MLDPIARRLSPYSLQKLSFACRNWYMNHRSGSLLTSKRQLSANANNWSCPWYRGSQVDTYCLRTYRALQRLCSPEHWQQVLAARSNAFNALLTCCRATSLGRRSSIKKRANLSFGPAPYLPTSYLPTRSTAPHHEPNRHC